jgi:tetratricopeptide (TPR) repeat protein
MEETIALDNCIIGIGDRANILSGTAQFAAKKILSLSFNSLKTGYDFALWGKAQVNEKSFKQAAEAYERASALAPYDVKIQFEYASALFYNKADFNKVRLQLMTAYRGIRPETSSDLIKDIYKGLTYHSLYHDGAVTGFSEAIKFGEEYIANRRSLPSGSIWLNLACAYGQKMSWLRANPSEQTTTVLTISQEQSQTLTQAINAVKQSLLLDPMSKTKFQELLEGTDASENDLAVFKDNENFRSATGL